MMFSKVLILLVLLANFAAFSKADEVREAAVSFKTKRWSSLKWKPSSYPSDGAVYDIYYYIPKNLKRLRNHPDGYSALVFLHGGGTSTTTPAGSTAAVNLYKTTLVKLAEALNVAVILPSGTGMNWGTHTPFYMRELIKMIRASLNVNPDRIGIAGHSMGGMAMTRIFYQIGDQVSFVMPLAAGLADLIPDNIKTHFNTPYYHLQGRKDIFDVFVTRCEAHAKVVSELEALYGTKSQFTMEFTDDDHSGVLKKLTNRVQKLLETPRNLYQTKLYGQWTPSLDHVEADIGRNIRVLPRDKYFWLEATQFAEGPLKTIPFTAEVKDNIYQITFDHLEQTPKKMRIYLSSKMVDFAKPILVFVNGKLVLTREPSGAPSAENADIFAEAFQDDGFRFEDRLEVTL